MVRRLPMELWAAPLCALLGLAPYLRIPAALLLLGVLPGLSICRHWLGVRSLPRQLILGSLFTLALVPALSIPLALLLGRSHPVLALAAPALLAIIPALFPRVAGREELPPLQWRPLALLILVALTAQIWMSAQIYPDPGTIRWQGLPDVNFFHGIYTQLGHELPPMDPENGGELLVHNWLYHFHFVQLGETTGLSIVATQRLASAWMAVLLLGLLFLLGSDILGSATAGTLAGLLTMSSGEIYWLVRSVARMDFQLITLPWAWSPMGLTLLFGWYNLAPLSMGLGAWYCLELSRRRSSGGWLAGSLVLCTVMAFFHPVFYGVFMTAFCLWMIGLWIRGERRPGRLLYLLTPLPFFLLYKLPYYGLSMPPSVVHPDPSITGMIDRAQNLFLWCGLLLVAGFPALLKGRHGFPASLTRLSILLAVLLAVPNPHWFNDLLGLVLALAAGVSLASVRDKAGTALQAAVLLLTLIPMGLHVRQSLQGGHSYSPSEQAAAQWLAGNTDPDDLVLIHPNSRSAYTVIGLAGSRVVHGFTGHLLDFKHDARDQEREVAEIFRSGSPSRVHELSHRYDSQLLYVGPDERAVIPAGRLESLDATRLFSSEEVEIFRLECPSDCPVHKKKGAPREGAPSDDG